jgi:endonuclease/exonuclease/phosphatase family metal-dependent hydrolase
MPGTAIVRRDEIQLVKNSKLQSGRAIAAKFREVRIINIYAPSGTARRQEREQFYNSELAYLLRDAPENIILCGDFNCILKKTNSTGTYYYSQALVELVRGFKLQDSWQGDPSRKPTHIIPQQERPGYIAYTSHRSYSPGSLV